MIRGPVIRPQKVAQRVVVLEPRQTVDRRPAGILGKRRRIGVLKSLMDPASQALALAQGRLVFERRGHDPVLQLNEDFFPELRVSPELRSLRKLLQIDVTFGLLPAVAVKTVVLKQRANFPRESRVVLCTGQAGQKT